MLDNMAEKGFSCRDIPFRDRGKILSLFDILWAKKYLTKVKRFYIVYISYLCLLFALFTRAFFIAQILIVEVRAYANRLNMAHFARKA
jgi:hypothetical protein